MATVDVNDGYSWFEWWLQLIWMMATVDVNDGYSWCEWCIQFKTTM